MTLQLILTFNSITTRAMRESFPVLEKPSRHESVPTILQLHLFKHIKRERINWSFRRNFLGKCKTALQNKFKWWTMLSSK
jgi:hypothetical protein